MSVTIEDMERLAVAQTLYKGIAEEVATASNGGNGIRAKADEALAELWESTGSKSLDVKLQGVKVGTFSLTVKDEQDVSDAKALEDFLVEHGFAERHREILFEHMTKNQQERLLGMASLMRPSAVVDVAKVDKSWTKQVSLRPDGTAVWTETGEVVPGVTVRQVPASTSLKVDEKKVLPLVQWIGRAMGAIGGTVAEEEVFEYETEEN